MLDLGAEGSVLHLFQCLECLGIGTKEGGAFIVHRSVLHEGLSTIAGYDLPAEYGSPLIGEVWITGWKEHDDGIPSARLPEFFDERRLWKLHDEFPQIDWFGSRGMTKSGGSPRWTGNGPMDYPRPPFEFLLQIDDYLYIDGPPPSPDAVGTSVEYYTQSSTNGSIDRVLQSPVSKKLPLNAPWFILHERGSNCYYLAFTNLASDGTAFVFIDRTKSPCGARWYFNR